MRNEIKSFLAVVIGTAQKIIRKEEAAFDQITCRKGHNRSRVYAHHLSAIGFGI